MTTVDVFAPAKINLTLHVTGRRQDGYHLLDSLIVFGGQGDVVRATASDRLTLEIIGPEAANLSPADDNLVLRAARFLGGGRGAALTLVKNLPVASGIGGGSADAAAALRALAELWDLPMPSAASTVVLGADVPVCLYGRPARMRGPGDDLCDVPPLPAMEILLVNPRVGVSTPQVFSGLTSRSNPAMADPLPDWPDLAAFTAWLAGQRNDLTAPAKALAPVIGEVLDLLGATGSRAHGMSGSGATCFAIFAPGEGLAAQQAIHQARPDWWTSGPLPLPAHTADLPARTA
ncbi:MAG: 4-(cytidine 5'-diphospho)-2-C-methyl-D-erythritol kinase [Marinibacterium sp.]